jgi:NAD(P)-dependent dehydrogenase (short-subunit alcohol dehydrogenase family)
VTTIASLMKLDGRRAVITGAAGGLGRAISETLAELGCDLVLVDRTADALEERANAVRKAWPVSVVAAICDLEQEDQRARLIDRVKRELGSLDILINNAGFVGTSDLEGWVTDFERQRVDTWRRALEVNLTAAFDLSKGFASMLKESAGGSIVNIASIYGWVGPDYSLYEDTAMGNPAAYAASKGGLIQLTRWLSTTLAPTTRVNAISPGGIFRNQPDAFVKRYERRTPLGRMGDVDDFRGAIAYLASDLSRYVTGHNLAVDGGWGVW